MVIWVSHVPCQWRWQAIAGFLKESTACNHLRAVFQVVDGCYSSWCWAKTGSLQKKILGPLGSETDQITSRGCGWNCTFTNLHQPTIWLAFWRYLKVQFGILLYEICHNYFLAQFRLRVTSPISPQVSKRLPFVPHSQALFWSSRRPLNRYPAIHISHDSPPQWENLELSCARNCLPCDGRCLDVIPRRKHLQSQRPRKKSTKLVGNIFGRSKNGTSPQTMSVFRRGELLVLGAWKLLFRLWPELVI